MLLSSSLLLGSTLERIVANSARVTLLSGRNVPSSYPFILPAPSHLEIIPSAQCPPMSDAANAGIADPISVRVNTAAVKKDKIRFFVICTVSFSIYYVTIDA